MYIYLTKTMYQQNLKQNALFLNKKQIKKFYYIILNKIRLFTIKS